MEVKPLMDIMISLGILLFVLAVVGMVVLSVVLPQLSRPKNTREPIDKPPPLPTLRQIEPLQTGHFAQVGTVKDAKVPTPYILTENVRMLNMLNIGPIGAGKTKFMLSTC